MARKGTRRGWYVLGDRAGHGLRPGGLDRARPRRSSAVGGDAGRASGFVQGPDEPGIAASLAKLGHAVLHQDDSDYLATLCQEAEGLKGAFTDRPAVGESFVFLGMVALYEGDLERAITLLEESLDLFRNLESEPHAAPDLEREGIELSTAIDLVAGQAQEYL